MQADKTSGTVPVIWIRLNPRKSAEIFADLYVKNNPLFQGLQKSSSLNRFSALIHYSKTQ